MNDLNPTPDVVAANQHHDIEHGDPYDFQRQRVRCAWNTAHMARRGLLTDRQIAKYQEQGFYSAEFKEARRKLQEAKRKRRGNFVIGDGGRMIYSPL